MPRTKSIDTNQVKALRKLLKSLGLGTTVANTIITQMKGRLSDLSSKACDLQLYLAAHPDIKNPAAYVATTLRKFAATATSKLSCCRRKADSAPALPSSAAEDNEDEPIQGMELWGNDD